MISKTYKDIFVVISNNKIISGPLSFNGTTFLDIWEDYDVEVDISNNKLSIISAPGEHSKDFLIHVVLDNIASFAQRDYHGYEASEGKEDFIILTEMLAQKKFPHLFH